jgi:hypothetical protein
MIIFFHDQFDEERADRNLLVVHRHAFELVFEINYNYEQVMTHIYWKIHEVRKFNGNSIIWP